MFAKKSEISFVKSDAVIINNCANIHGFVKMFKFFCFIKFKSKHKNNFSYTTNNQKGSIRFENQKLKLPKIGFIKVVRHRKIPENFRLKSATISKTPSEKYFASILFEHGFAFPKVEHKSFLGLDF